MKTRKVGFIKKFRAWLQGSNFVANIFLLQIQLQITFPAL